jgi:uncharacterized membrane protein YeaQ/YmgE (transglycosylase-associated protein family)
MTFDMTWIAFGVVILVALVLGVLVQMYLQPKTSYEWLITAVGAGVGAWLASEINWSQWFSNVGPVWEGLAIIPAVIGGLILGAVFVFGARAIEPAQTHVAA